MSETRSKRKIEFIESYWTGGELGSDYQWNDNHGELIRCKDCINLLKLPMDRHGHQPYFCKNLNTYTEGLDWFCADGERKDS